MQYWTTNLNINFYLFGGYKQASAYVIDPGKISNTNFLMDKLTEKHTSKTDTFLQMVFSSESLLYEEWTRGAVLQFVSARREGATLYIGRLPIFWFSGFWKSENCQCTSTRICWLHTLRIKSNWTKYAPPVSHFLVHRKETLKIKLINNIECCK